MSISMEAKAQQSSEPRYRFRLLKFIGELKEELKKVSWTTKAELTSCTKIVLGAIFAFGLSVYIADLVIKGALDTVASVARLIFG